MYAVRNVGCVAGGGIRYPNNDVPTVRGFVFFGELYKTRAAAVFAAVFCPWSLLNANSASEIEAVRDHIGVLAGSAHAPASANRAAFAARAAVSFRVCAWP